MQSTLQIDASLIFSFIALIGGSYSAVVAYFVKREIASLDAAKTLIYKTAGEAQIMKTEMKQLAIDLEKSNEKADNIVNNYKTSFREVNSKLDTIVVSMNSFNVALSSHIAREESLHERN